MSKTKRESKKSLAARAELAVMLFAKSLASINLTGGKSPLITSREKEMVPDQPKVSLKSGDWVRVRRGPLRGAEGKVERLEKMSELVTIVEVRQLNGNLVRLPRAYWEFSAFKPEVLAE